MNEVVSKTLETLRDMVSQSKIEWDAVFDVAESVAQDLSVDGRMTSGEASVASVICAVAAFHLGRWSDAHAWTARAVDLDSSSF